MGTLLKHTLPCADVCVLSHPGHAQGLRTSLVLVRTPSQGWWGEWEGERGDREESSEVP